MTSLPSPRRRRLRWLVPALLLAFVLDLGAATAVGLHLAARPGAQAGASTSRPTLPDARARPPVAEDVRRAALGQLLQQRSRAVLAHDRAQWTSTTDPTSRAFARQQARTFDGVRHLAFSRWSYEIAGAGPAVTDAQRKAFGSGAWNARVFLHYRLSGFDSADVIREQLFTLVPTAARGWRLAAEVRQPTAPRDLWELGEISVARGTRSLVIGAAGGHTDLSKIARQADAATDRVSRVWGDHWPRTVVVLVPSSEQEMATVLGRGRAGLDQIAAVTTGQVSRSHSASRTTGDRVVVNPGTYSPLSPLGQRVVLTHETTHVATRAATSTAVPTWLSEGFADYVGYLGSGASTAQAAHDLLATVARGSVPEHLPGTADFDATKGDIAPAYEGAWLACRLLAETKGQDALVRFYRTVAEVGRNGGVGLAAGFRDLGTTQKTFEAAWRSYLRRQVA